MTTGKRLDVVIVGGGIAGSVLDVGACRDVVLGEVVIDHVAKPGIEHAAHVQGHSACCGTVSRWGVAGRLLQVS